MNQRQEWMDRTCTAHVITLVLIAIAIAATPPAVIHAQVSDMEARRSLRTYLTVTKARYCATPTTGIDVLELSLAVEIRNIGTKPVIIPRGPYSIPCIAVARNEAELKDSRYELTSCQPLTVDERDQNYPMPGTRPFDDKLFVVIAPGDAYTSTSEILVDVSRKPPLTEAPAPSKFSGLVSVVVNPRGPTDSYPPPANGPYTYTENQVLVTGTHVITAYVFLNQPTDTLAKVPPDWSAKGLFTGNLRLSEPMTFVVDGDRTAVDCK